MRAATLGAPREERCRNPNTNSAITVALDVLGVTRADGCQDRHFRHFRPCATPDRVEVADGSFLSYSGSVKCVGPGTWRPVSEVGSPSTARPPDDHSGGFGPDEGCRVFVPVGDESLDVPDEVRDRIERAASDGRACEDAEPRFDEVDPGCAPGCEVQGDSRVGREPRLDPRRRVRGGVVDDHVEVPAGTAACHPLDKAQEVGPAVRGRALSDDPAGRWIGAWYAGS